MPSNSIPLITGEWILGAMRQRLDEIKREAAVLQTVTEQHGLSAEVQHTCREVLSGIQCLDDSLTQLETSAEQIYHRPREQSTMSFQ